MFDRPQIGERAVLVNIRLPAAEASAELAEFSELARSAGAHVVAVVEAVRRRLDPKYFIGVGKVAEVGAVVEQCEADLVIINAELSPAQERNLEQALSCRVLDRTTLILDIFAQRATSHEGRLQVELAQLQHLSTRLVRGWTHLERQKGGIGLRGPGETQLETDRRLIGERIKQLQKRLAKVIQRRQLSRKSRAKAELPVISLVGYTNAGKSTLFNALTDASVFAANQLFATLDPTLRRIDLNGGGQAVVADTVGFIRDLPHDLIAAFRATLEEAQSANVLLHVIDASGDDINDATQQVNAVLKEIGAEQVSQIEVFNKIDLKPGQEPRFERGPDGRVRRVWVSAATGAGLEYLRQAISEFFQERNVDRWLRLPQDNGRMRARVYSLAEVLDEQHDVHGDVLLHVRVSDRNFGYLHKHEGVEEALAHVLVAGTG